LATFHVIYDVSDFRTCLELGEVCREVGLPPGVLNILTGLGTEAGAPLASHPHVDKVQYSVIIFLLDTFSSQILMSTTFGFYIYLALIANKLLTGCIYWEHCYREQDNGICSSNGQGMSCAEQFFVTYYMLLADLCLTTACEL